MGSSASPGTCSLGCRWGSPQDHPDLANSPIICSFRRCRTPLPPAWRSRPAEHRGQFGANWSDPAGSVCCLESRRIRGAERFPGDNAVEPWAPPQWVQVEKLLSDGSLSTTMSGSRSVCVRDVQQIQRISGERLIEPWHHAHHRHAGVGLQPAAAFVKQLGGRRKRLSAAHGSEDVPRASAAAAFPRSGRTPLPVRCQPPGNGP